MEKEKPIDLNKLNWQIWKIEPVTIDGVQLARIVPKYEAPEYPLNLPYKDD